MIPFLDEADVRAALRWEDLIPAMAEALAEFSAGRVKQPVRSVLTVEQAQRYMGIMPAASEHALGVKVVTFYPKNAGSTVPTHMALVLLFKPETGEPLAVMDGRLITEMRTAAVSAAVTDRLASPQAHILALLGSGVQAKAHLQALSRVRRFDDIRIWSRSRENAEAFAKECGGRATDAE